MVGVIIHVTFTVLAGLHDHSITEAFGDIVKGERYTLIPKTLDQYLNGTYSIARAISA